MTSYPWVTFTQTISVLPFASLLFKAYFVYTYICIINQVVQCIIIILAVCYVAKQIFTKVLLT